MKDWNFLSNFYYNKYIWVYFCTPSKVIGRATIKQYFSVECEQGSLRNGRQIGALF